MTGVLWVAFGITLGAAVLHAALGLTRPLARTYVRSAAAYATPRPIERSTSTSTSPVAQQSASLPLMTTAGTR